MTIKDYMYPTRSTQLSCITLLSLTTNFEIRSGMIQTLPVFRGLTNDPYQHVREFEDISETMKYNQIIEKYIPVLSE